MFRFENTYYESGVFSLVSSSDLNFSVAFGRRFMSLQCYWWTPISLLCIIYWHHFGVCLNSRIIIGRSPFSLTPFSLRTHHSRWETYSTYYPCTLHHCHRIDNIFCRFYTSPNLLSILCFPWPKSAYELFSLQIWFAMKSMIIK